MLFYTCLKSHGARLPHNSRTGQDWAARGRCRRRPALVRRRPRRQRHCAAHRAAHAPPAAVVDGDATTASARRLAWRPTLERGGGLTAGTRGLGGTNVVGTTAWLRSLPPSHCCHCCCCRCCHCRCCSCRRCCCCRCSTPAPRPARRAATAGKRGGRMRRVSLETCGQRER